MTSPSRAPLRDGAREARAWRAIARRFADRRHRLLHGLCGEVSGLPLAIAAGLTETAFLVWPLAKGAGEPRSPAHGAIINVRRGS